MNLIDRVKRILVSPRTEWEVIDTEATTPAELFTGYVMPLAAITPIGQIIGYSVFGVTVPLPALTESPSAQQLPARW